MTWFWFVLLGIIALVARKSIAAWVGTWSDDAIKQVAVIGLIGFGIMATFGVAISAGVWPLHIGAALGGILGFFAVSESAGRTARQARLARELGRQRRRELDENSESQPADPAMRRQDTGYPEHEPLVRIAEPPLITDEDSEAHILELLERAAGQWENPETDTPAPVAPEPRREAFQSVAQILKRAAEREVQVEAAGAFHNVPAATHTLPVMLSEPPDASQPAPESRFSMQRAPVDDAVAGVAEPPQPAGVKLAGTPLMMAAQTLSPDSAVARASGPVKLGRSLPLRPPGPLSLGGTSPGPVPMEQHSKSGGFHYQPQMVRSRLGTSTPPAKKESAPKAEPAAKPEPVEPPPQAGSQAPSAELQ